MTVKELEDLTSLAEELDFDSVWTLDRIGRMEVFPKALPIMVLTADGDHIIEITGFADPALFPDVGLPARLEG